MKRIISLISLALLFAMLVSSCSEGKKEVKKDMKKVVTDKLVSKKLTGSISVDGTVDAKWNDATSFAIKVDKNPYKPSNGYPGLKETTVNIKSLYDNEFVYFLIQYKDATKSHDRFPWEKQADGTWKQLMNKDDTGHDNTYYEDKFAIFWNINTRGFEKKGCAIACHMKEDGKVNGVLDKSAGRKYTNAGETIDMWHWKSCRSNPVGSFDDQYVNSDKKPEQDKKNWGRHGDTGSGPYKTNISADKKTPKFMNKDKSADKFWLTPEEQTPFVDTFKAGDRIAGILVDKFPPARADISAKGVWKDGVWTIEFKRKLITTEPKAEVQDVQFKDLTKDYYFGIAVFDNSQINHVYHDKAYSMVFE